MSKTVVIINPKFRFSANLHDTQTQERLFASFQNSVKKTMIFQPTNQLNVKET